MGLSDDVFSIANISVFIDFCVITNILVSYSFIGLFRVVCVLRIRLIIVIFTYIIY